MCRVLIATDDTFPPISNILGLEAHGDDIQRYSRPNTLSHARCPIRASTFDGRTLYIKKKARVIERGKVRLYRLGFHPLTCRMIGSHFSATVGQVVGRAHT